MLEGYEVVDARQYQTLRHNEKNNRYRGIKSNYLHNLAQPIRATYRNYLLGAEKKNSRGALYELLEKQRDNAKVLEGALNRANRRIRKLADFAQNIFNDSKEKPPALDLAQQELADRELLQVLIMQWKKGRAGLKLSYEDSLNIDRHVYLYEQSKKREAAD